MTILTASLPWHVTYAGFEGTLPNIRRVLTIITGVEFLMREPAFGVTCLAENATLESIYSRSTTSGAITEAVLHGEAETNCGILMNVSGTTTNVTERSGARITLPLI